MLIYGWSSVSESSQAFGATTVFNNILAILIGNNIPTVVLTLYFFIVEYLGGEQVGSDLCNKANIAIKQVMCSCCFPNAYKSYVYDKY